MSNEVNNELLSLEEIEVLEDMFTHAGWEIFMLDIAANYKAIDSIDGLNSGSELFLAKGQKTALGSILNYEGIVELVKQQHQEDQQEADNPDG